MTVTLVNSGVQFNDTTVQTTSAISVKKLQSTAPVVLGVQLF